MDVRAWRVDPTRWIYLASALAAVVLMGRMTDGFFLADDYNFLFIGKWISNPFKFFYKDHFEGVFFRPVGMAVIWTWTRLFGSYYWAYAACIAALHLANGWGVGRIAIRLGYSGPSARLASALFWLSPVAVGTSVWFSDLFYSLTVLFFLAALEWLSFCVRSNRQGVLRLLPLFPLALASALSHDGGIACVGALGVAGLYWNRQRGEKLLGRPNLRLVATLGCVVLFYVLYRSAVLGHFIQEAQTPEFTVAERLMAFARFLPLSFAARAEAFLSWGSAPIYFVLGGVVALYLSNRIADPNRWVRSLELIAPIAMFGLLVLPSVAYGLDRIFENPEIGFWQVVGVRILYIPLPAACWTLAALTDGIDRRWAVPLRDALLAVLLFLMLAIDWPMSGKILEEMREISQPIYRGAEAAFEGIDYRDATTLVISGLPNPHGHYMTTLVGSLPPNRGRWLIVAEEAQRNYSAYIYPYPKRRLAPLSLADDGLRNPSGFDRILVIKTDRVPDRATLCQHGHVRIIEARPNRPAWIFEDKTQSICQPYHDGEPNHVR